MSCQRMPYRAGAPFLQYQRLNPKSFVGVSMPSRAGASFLRGRRGKYEKKWNFVSMSSRTGAPSLLIFCKVAKKDSEKCINALSGWCSISTYNYDRRNNGQGSCINALSGWCFISTRRKYMSALTWGEYQCPFGLGLHFYWEYRKKNRSVWMCINALSG